MSSDVIADLFWEDEVGCKWKAFLTRWGQMWVLGLSDMGFGCVPPMVRCECWECLFEMVLGFVPPMVICKCWVGLSDMVHSMVRYKCWRQWRPTWRLGLQPKWKRVGFLELTVTSRIEISLVMMTQWWSSNDDPDQVMIQTWWWSDDDPDLMMIQWCSRSSDDPELMMI